MAWAWWLVACSSCSRWVHRRCSGLHRPSRLVFHLGVPATGHPSFLVSSPPAQPTQTVASPFVSSGAIIQFNCNGYRHCAVELRDLAEIGGALVILLHETKLAISSNLKQLPNCSFLRCDRLTGGRGGGLKIQAHHSISYSPINTSTWTEPTPSKIKQLERPSLTAALQYITYTFFYIHPAHLILGLTSSRPLPLSHFSSSYLRRIPWLERVWTPANYLVCTWLKSTCSRSFRCN